MQTKHDFHYMFTSEAMDKLHQIILEAYNSKFEGEVELVTGLGKTREKFLKYLGDEGHNFRVNSSNLGCIYLDLDYADQWMD